MSAPRQLFFVATIFGALCASTASAQPQLVRDLIAGGGASMGSSNYAVRGSVGQTVTGSSSSPSFTTDAGFWLEPRGLATAVGDGPARPRILRLDQNHPNPFNPHTTISFAVPATARVRLRVYDVAGRLVDELIDEVRTPGVYEHDFAPTNLSSGIYLYRLEAGSAALQRKLVLLK